MEVVVGRVAKAHGIGGELTVDVRTDVPEVRFADGAVLAARSRDKQTRPVTVQSARPHGSRMLVRFAEVADRTAAEGLRGAVLLADTDDLPPTDEEDEFYDHQLAGLAAELADGTQRGTVREVVHTAGGELLAVEFDGREVLVPFVRAIVPMVDLERGRVVLAPPEGLF
ncbi:MAG: ribosome maturation factor RimM [Thermocrispum sp.]